MKKSFLGTLSLFIALSASSQNTPIALDLQKNVNLFRGSFNYQIPLVTVSGPNGESFPIGLNYNSRVTVNQEASWVGLGWNVPLGEISRRVNGFPDDWKGKSYTERSYHESAPVGTFPSQSTVVTKNAYGPVHFKDFVYSGNSRMDLFSSWRGIDGMSSDHSPFEGPDYDNYYVSGPGISGEMKPYLFEYANLFYESTAKWTYGNSTDPNVYKKFSKPVQFRIKGENSTEVKMPHYNNSKHHNIESQKAGPNYTWPGAGGTWDAAMPFPTVSSPFTGDIDENATDQRQRSKVGTYIEYFTNQEIYDHYAGTNIIDGFIDYDDFTLSTCNRIDNDYFDPDGIGAFRVTNMSGMVYHYSLPVYNKGSKVTEFTLYDNGEVTGNKYADYHKEYDNGARHANSWKLTAITGPDYVDNNSTPNSFVDEEDKGYWIYINYGKWTKNNGDFVRRYPYFGCNIDKTYSQVPLNNTGPQVYQLTGSFSTVSEEIYYPNYVKTKTQTAFFVKQIRMDNHGDVAANFTPRLRLTNVILVNNKDVVSNNFFQSYAAFTSPSFPNMQNVVNTQAVLEHNNYSTIQSTLDPISLKHVELVHDYSLARKNYNNVNNSPSITSKFVGNQEAYSFVNSITDNGDGGKLTLKELRVYNYGKVNIYDAGNDPAYVFTYESGLHNPDFNPRNKDHFGFYKKPTTSSFDQLDYLDASNKDYADAWCLKEIKTPLGNEILIDYESNEYNKVYYRQGKWGNINNIEQDIERYEDVSGQIVRTPVTTGYGDGPRVKSIAYWEPGTNQEYKLDIDYLGGAVGIEPARHHVETDKKLKLRLVKTHFDRFGRNTSIGYGAVKVTPKGDIPAGGEDHTGSLKYYFNKAPAVHVNQHWFGKRQIILPANGGEYWHFKEVVKLTLHNLNSYGRLEQVDQLAKNGILLRSTMYNYSKTHRYTEKDYGSVQEIFYKIREENQVGNKDNYKSVLILEERYPVLKSITVDNGKAKSATIFADRDKYTNIPKKHFIKNNSSGSYELEKTFARDTYSEMGLKSDNKLNSNQLTVAYLSQENRSNSSKSYSTLDEQLAIRKLNASSVYATQNENTSIFKPIAVYQNNDDPDQANWEKVSTNTLFDENLNSIESKSVNGNFSAVQIEGVDQLPIAVASASNYASFFHCGFEYVTTASNGAKYFEKELNHGEQQILDDNLGLIKPHTGSYMVKVSGAGPAYTLKQETSSYNGEFIERGVLTGRTYEASIWVHNNSSNFSELVVDINGPTNGGIYTQTYTVNKTNASNITIGDWTKMSITFTVPEDLTTPGSNDYVRVHCRNNSESGHAYFDDFRLQPIDASVSATVYDQRRLLPLYTIDNENFYTRYEYDASGNATKVYQEIEGGEVLRRESTIHFDYAD